MHILAMFGRILAHTFTGALLLPVVALAFSLVIYMMEPRCGTPGDSGGCEMGLAAFVMMAVPAGAVLGFLVGLWRVVRARMAVRPPPQSSTGHG